MLCDANKSPYVEIVYSTGRSLEFPLPNVVCQGESRDDCKGTLSVNVLLTLKKSVIDMVPKQADITSKIVRPQIENHPQPANNNQSQPPKQEDGDSFKRSLKKIAELKKQMDSVSEQQLLGDFVTVLRGYNGEYVHYNEAQPGFKVNPRIKLSGATVGYCEQVIFYADVYRRIRTRVSGKEAKSGAIRSAYLEAVKRELELYQAEVLKFEKDLVRVRGLPELLVRLSKWKLFLLTLDSITHSLDSLTGHALPDAILKYMDFSEHETGRMTVRIFDACCVPILKMVDSFLRFGKIDDPFDEFFIQATLASENDLNWWNTRYKIIPERVPIHLNEGRGIDIVLSLGKTRALLQMTANADTHEVEDMEIDARDWDAMVDEWEKMGKEVNKRALDALLKEGNLLQHLENIQRFMLLTEGDFSKTLMDLLGDALSKPASTLLRHNLVSILDSATERYSEDVKERLDVRLLESNNPKSQGWDVFCLDYRMDPALSAVINNQAMLEYARLGHFLWSLKRVEFQLSLAWGRLVKTFRIGKVHRRQFDESFILDQKRMELLVGEMKSFIQQVLNLAYHAMQGPHQDMVKNMRTICVTVDDLIREHDAFIVKVKDGFGPWSDNKIRAKLGQVCASCLRIDSLVRHHCASVLNNIDVSGDQQRQRFEQRAAFQTVARTFQSELDEFMAWMRQDGDRDNLEFCLASLDLSGYHSRRPIYDVKKYANAN